MRYYAGMFQYPPVRYAVYDDANRCLCRDLHPEQAHKTALRLAAELQDRVWLVGDDESEHEVMPE